MAKLYADLGKTAKKLLNDDYIFNAKLKVASVTDDGRTFTVTGATNPKTGLIAADLAVKQKLGPHTLTTKLFTHGAAQSELKLENFGLDGLNTTLVFGVGEKEGTTKLEYQQGRIGLVAFGDYYKKKANASCAAVLSTGKMSGFAVIGAETGYDAETSEFGGASAAVSYFDGRESEVTVHVADKGAKGKISYSHQVRPDFAVAGQMEYKSGIDALLTLGAAAKLDAHTTVKGKLDSTGQLALTYLQVIRPKTTLTLSTAFDVKELKSPKMGVSLAIE